MDPMQNGIRIGRMSAPRGIRWVQGLFLLNAGVWLLLGVLSFGRLSSVPWIVALLMFGNSLALLVCAWGSGRPQRWAFFLALAVLLVNLLLTITDEFGIFDLLTLTLDLLLLVLLVRNWGYYAGEA